MIFSAGKILTLLKCFLPGWKEGNLEVMQFLKLTDAAPNASQCNDNKFLSRKKWIHVLFVFSSINQKVRVYCKIKPKSKEKLNQADRPGELWSYSFQAFVVGFCWNPEY